MTLFPGYSILCSLFIKSTLWNDFTNNVLLFFAGTFFVSVGRSHLFKNKLSSEFSCWGKGFPCECRLLTFVAPSSVFLKQGSSTRGLVTLGDEEPFLRGSERGGRSMLRLIPHRITPASFSYTWNRSGRFLPTFYCGKWQLSKNIAIIYKAYALAFSVLSLL